MTCPANFKRANYNHYSINLGKRLRSNYLSRWFSSSWMSSNLRSTFRMWFFSSMVNWWGATCADWEFVSWCKYIIIWYVLPIWIYNYLNENWMWNGAFLFWHMYALKESCTFQECTIYIRIIPQFYLNFTHKLGCCKLLITNTCVNL